MVECTYQFLPIDSAITKIITISIVYEYYIHIVTPYFDAIYMEILYPWFWKLSNNTNKSII